MQSQKRITSDYVLPTSKLILLKYLDNHCEQDRIPSYFTYYHQLDVDKCIEEFWDNHLIDHASADDTIKHCTIPQLKKMLSENNLPLSGNKSVLIERLVSNVNENALLQNMDTYTVVTDKGKELLNSLSDDDWNNRFPTRSTLSNEERFKQRFAKSMSEIDSLKNIRAHLPVRYTVRTMKDTAVCECCKSFENKTLDVKDAVVGVNYPPFKNCTCDFCRCFSVSEIIDG